MGATFGNNFRVTLFGQSHSDAMGAIVEGVNSGTEIDIGYIEKELSRRAAYSHGEYATPRREKDDFRILSGVIDGKATGDPISIVMENRNADRSAYDSARGILRPSHADYSLTAKYGPNGDLRGGGSASGRMTAPLTAAGAIAKQILFDMAGITVGSHIFSLGNVRDAAFDRCDIPIDLLERLREERLPFLRSDSKMQAEEEMKKARGEKDSLGGIIECAAIGMRPGIGSPFFDSVESRIAQIMFSVPACKGVDFGSGFAIARMKGSQANDPFIMSGGRVKTKTNNSGGINGGITNGMPVVFRAAFRPTPTIGLPQQTVDMSDLREVTHEFEGRHDACFLPRAVPVVEGCAAIALLDLYLER